MQYSRIVMAYAIVRNDTDKALVIQHGSRLGHLRSLDPGCNAYLVDPKDTSAVAELALKNPMDRTSQASISMTVDNAADTARTITHRTGVRIYDNPDQPGEAAVLTDLINRYGDVFRDTGFAKVPINQLG